MTLREKIADWISGGAVTKRDEKIHELQRMCGSWRVNSSDESGRARRAEREYFRLRSKLHDIAAQETPGANATVRRMARMAREGLGK